MIESTACSCWGSCSLQARKSTSQTEASLGAQPAHDNNLVILRITAMQLDNGQSTRRPWIEDACALIACISSRAALGEGTSLLLLSWLTSALQISQGPADLPFSPGD